MRATHECIEGAMQTAKDQGTALRVVGVGITNQRQTTVAWDRHTGQPFHRAIVWCDNRTADTCSHFKRKLGSSVGRFSPSDWVYMLLLGTVLHTKNRNASNTRSGVSP